MSVPFSTQELTNEIAAQTGKAFLLRAGQKLEVVDPYGKQVADLFCLCTDNPRDVLSSGRSIDYEDTIRFTTGNILFSHAGRPMLKIVADSCGTHDFLVTPCSLQMFKMLDPACMYHPSCEENIHRALREFGVIDSPIGTTFNIFMNVPVHHTGGIRVLPPASLPGDRVTFQAQCDLLVALTACADEGTNAGFCKPVHYRIS